MSEKKHCPACGARIWGDGKECTACKREIEVLCWEVESARGVIHFRGKNGITELRERLVDRTIRPGDRCRQRVERMTDFVDNTERFETSEERDWKSLREYADKEFALRILYDPVKACANRAAFITFGVVFVIVAVAWIADGMLAAGAHPLAAVLIGALMLALAPTIVGLIIGALVVGAMYGIPGMGVGFRTIIAMLLGAGVGAVLGWTVGYGIGALIGLRKPHAVTLESKDSPG